MLVIKQFGPVTYAMGTLQEILAGTGIAAKVRALPNDAAGCTLEMSASGWVGCLGVFASDAAMATATGGNYANLSAIGVTAYVPAPKAFVSGAWIISSNINDENNISLVDSIDTALAATKKIHAGIRDVCPVGLPRTIKINSNPVFNPSIHAISAPSLAFSNGCAIAQGTSSEKIIFINDNLDVFRGISCDISLSSKVGSTVKIGFCLSGTPYYGHCFCINFDTGAYWIEGNYGTAYTGTITTDLTLISTVASIGFTIQRNTITGWIKSSTSQWAPIAAYEIGGFVELRAKNALDLYRWAVKHNIPTGTTLSISNIQCGSAGHTGLADFTTVHNSDGSLYLDGEGNAYTTATLRGPMGGFATGVFRVTPDGVISRTGTLLFENNGIIYGHASSTLVYNKTTGTWLILTSTLGDIGYSPLGTCRIVYTQICGDPLHRTCVYTYSVCTSIYSYDVDVILFGGIWYMVFMTTSFAMGVKSAATLSDLLDPQNMVALIIAANAIQPQAEGPHFVIIGGELYIMVGYVQSTGAALLYDVAGNYIGNAFPILPTNESDIQSWGGNGSHPAFFNFSNAQNRDIIFIGFSSNTCIPATLDNSGKYTASTTSWQYGDALIFKCQI